MIKACLNEQELVELYALRRQASSQDSEKALMVLLSNEGKNISEIAITIKRHPHTVRQWIKRYNSDGLIGLNRKYSAGRPREKRDAVKKVIQEIITKSPTDFGYVDYVWSIQLITHYLQEKNDIFTSKYTVQRSLKELNYSYKRPSKQPPERAPNREDKLAAIEEIITQIQAIVSDKESEIFALDESHFSTEPYLIRGWFFKR